MIHVEYIDVDDLVALEGNPKRHDLKMLTGLITRFGFTSPIVLNETTGSIVAGHGRAAAVRQLRDGGEAPPDRVHVREDGAWCVPVVRGVDLSESEARAYAVADNRATEVGGWDDEALAAILREAATTEDGLGGIGFTDADLDRLAGEAARQAEEAAAQADPATAVTDADEAPAPTPPTAPTTKPGDLWRLGDHVLVCGDATDGSVVQRALEGEPIGLVIADPPYGVKYTGGAKAREALAGDETTDLYVAAVRALEVQVAPDVALYVYHDTRYVGVVKAALEEGDFEGRSHLIWAKNNATFSNFAIQYHQKHEGIWYAHARGHAPRWHGPNNETTVWECPRAARNDYHPTQKPVELAARMMRNSGDPALPVLDPFGGSGSTLIAAERMGRRAALVELDPGYCDVIVRRWEAATGKVAVRE